MMIFIDDDALWCNISSYSGDVDEVDVLMVFCFDLLIFLMVYKELLI